MEENHYQQQALQELPPAVVKVRWKPNEEQLRMLVRLFEEEGDSINKQRIKEIAVDLARQGDVTEANVHNWFHNRKARAKRKQKLMQQNDGESEVDTDVDSKGKRSKLDHHHHHHHHYNATSKIAAASPPNGTLFLPEFSQPEAQQGFPMRQPLRLPSDAINLNTRMYDNSLMLTPHHPHLAPPPPPPPPPHHHHHHHQAAAATGVTDKFRMPAYSQELVPETHMIEWRPHHQLALMPTQPGTDLQDRSSESKTITDDASTESEDISDSRAWSSKQQQQQPPLPRKTWKKKARGTMIRKAPPQLAAPVATPAVNGRASNRNHHGASTRKSKIRDILKGLKRSNPDSYERDLKALFVEVVKRIGANKARSILNRLTRPPDTDTSSSSDSQAMDSGSCSSTASLPRQARRVSSSSPSDFNNAPRAGNNNNNNNNNGRGGGGGGEFYSDAVSPYSRFQAPASEQPSFYHQKTQSSYGQHQQSSAPVWDSSSARQELTLSSSSRQYQQQQQQQQFFQQQQQQGQGQEQQQQQAYRDSKTSSSTEDDDDDTNDGNEEEGSLQDGEETDGDKEFRIVWSSQKKQQQQQPEAFSAAIPPQSFESRCEDLPPPSKQEKKQQQQQSDGEKTNVTLIDGKPTGATGTWWNSILRHSALLFLDVSIPHIALQPEEGMVRIRDYMDSKFTYVGGSLDDGFLKKQVAKALNFRRHKVMRMIEQGSGRPSDVSQEQWDSLVRYYADPKRREKSDKQRAALKALNLSNQRQIQQHQLQQQQQQQQLQQHEIHPGLNLNISHQSIQQEQHLEDRGACQENQLSLAVEEEDDDEEDEDEEDEEEQHEDDEVQ